MTGNGSGHLTEGGSQEVKSVSSEQDCIVQDETSICWFKKKKKALKDSVDVCMTCYMNSVCKWAVAFPVWILHSEINQQWNLVVWYLLVIQQ